MKLLTLLTLVVGCSSSGSASDAGCPCRATSYDAANAVEDDAGEDAIDAAATATLNVYLIAGQSNAGGGAQVAELSPENSSFAEAYANVQFAEELECPVDFLGGACERTTGWRPLAPRPGGGTNEYFGIELSAGRRLDERFGEVAIIKHATSGTNIWKEWDTNTPNSLWQYMTTFVDARMAELPPGARIAGFLWIQGDGDANTPQAAGSYGENLGWFIMRLRQEYGAAIPVVLARVNPLGSYGAAVQSGQDQVSTYVSGVTVVETADLALRDDQHYAADSFIELGQRMANAMPAPEDMP